MNADPRWPLVPQPPHDPRALLLAGWIGPQPKLGWRLRRLSRVELDPARKVLQLAPAPEASRRLTEAGGSFGGWRLPSVFALGPQGDLYLLDRLSGSLARFDACTCRFERVPCGTHLVRTVEPCENPGALGAPAGRAHAPLNALNAPEAIAICDGSVFIADAGHARVLRLALAGFVPRAALTLPKAGGLAAGSWRPAELAFDGHGTLFVLDRSHARIDRFDRTGRWHGPPTSHAGLEHIAVDCDDRLLAVAASFAVGNTALAPGAHSFVALDGGADSTDWRALTVSGLAPGSVFDIEVATGDIAAGVAQLQALDATVWRRWLVGVDASANGCVNTLAVDAARALWLRFTPHAGSAPTNVAVTATVAHALRRPRADAAFESIDVRASQHASLRAPRAEVTVTPLSDGALRVECCGRPNVFDGHGRWLSAASAPPAFHALGNVLFHALDSRIDGCQWHSVALRGTLPAGCSVEVRTLASALPLDEGEIAAMPSNAWGTHAVLAADDACTRECLVTSPPGRFLWLSLIVRGDTGATPCIESIEVEYPRVSLRRYMPAIFGAEAAGADFTDRFSALYDRTLRSIERHVDRLPMLFDPLSTTVDAKEGRVEFLAWLAHWVGVSMSRDWAEERRRVFLKQAARLYCLRGTREGLWRLLLLLLGFDRAAGCCPDERPRSRCIALPRNCAPAPARTKAAPPPIILEHFKLRRWLHAGQGRLGSDSELWGAGIVNRSQLDANAQIGVTRTIATPDPLRDPFHVYAHKFSVFVPARVRDCATERRALEQLLAREAPAHTQADIRYVEPRFRVGVQAMVGLDSVVARTPRGVALAGADARPHELGQGTVLGAPPHEGTQARVGDARVGSGFALH